MVERSCIAVVEPGLGTFVDVIRIRDNISDTDKYRASV